MARRLCPVRQCAPQGINAVYIYCNATLFCCMAEGLSAWAKQIRLFACCCIVLFLFFRYIFFFMYKCTTAPWAGQKSEKQPKFKDKFIHEARWAVKNITTALAAVDHFLFHNAPKVANEELSINYHAWWRLSIYSARATCLLSHRLSEPLTFMKAPWLFKPADALQPRCQFLC